MAGSCRYAEVVADGLCLAVFRQSAAAICWALKCQVRVCAHACAQAGTHAHTGAHTHTHRLMHVHTHSHAHTRMHTRDMPLQDILMVHDWAPLTHTCMTCPAGHSDGT